MSNRDAGRGLILVGSGVGLIAVVGLGTSRFALQETPERQAQLWGNGVFGLAYLSPFLLALAASRVGDSSVLETLVLGATLLSLAASFSAFSGVKLAHLPATALLFGGRVKSVRAVDGRIGRQLRFAIVNLAFA